MFAHCRGPKWQGDDLSLCFQADYLQTLFPLVACAVSLFIILLQVVALEISRRRHGKRLAILVDATDDAALEDCEEEGSEPDLTLQRSASRTSLPIRDIDRPRGEVTLVSIELIALLGQLSVSLVALLTGQHAGYAFAGRTAAAGVAVWIYIAIIVSLRLFLSTSRWRFAFSRLWNHTACLYGVQWLLEVFVFRSVIIHPRGNKARILTIAEFAFTTLLLLIALVSRKGNKGVLFEYEGDVEPSPEPVASILSLVSFTWVDPIIWRGWHKTLEVSDVWNLQLKDKAEAVLSTFRQVKKTHGLAVRLLFYFKKELLIQGAWAAVGSVFMFLPTLILRAILQYLEDPVATPANAAWLYVILLFFSGVVQAVANGQALWIGRRICIQLRAVIIGEIYSKTLRRKAAASTETELGKEAEKQPKTTSRRLLSLGRKKRSNDKDRAATAENKSSDTQVNNGTIINLMSIDSFKVSDICAYLHFLWAETPVQLAMAIGLLYKVLGPASFAGIGVMALILPLNFFIAKSFQAAQKRIMAATDKRIHSTNEVLQNIRIIKYFAWEKRFTDDVSDKRRTELKALRRKYILWALAAMIWSAIPILITFISFFIYTVVQKKPLVPSVAFPALSMFSLLRIPLDQLADMVAHIQESKVSVDRVEEFLREEETDKYVQLHQSKQIYIDEPRIALRSATLSWGAKSGNATKDTVEAFKLIDMDVEFTIGRLNIIAGPTGSGKTSLLMALLGEMKLIEGNVQIPGGYVRQDLRPDTSTGLTESVAYCAQQAWLVNDTIKENILFATPYDQQRYKEVLSACALERDLEILDAGDQTLVGEKGITMSGGQKQRISLARAMYCNSKHLLLDDCLSAVDSHTAKHIFEEAIMGKLMKDRTCILVTHNVSLTVPRSSFVVVLENGKITAQGEPVQVTSSGALGDDLLRSRPPSRGNSTVPSRVPSNLEEERSKLSGRQSSLNGMANGETSKNSKSGQSPIDTRIESKAVGSVKAAIIKMYLKSMGPWVFWVFAATSFIATQVGSVATNVWIRQWANSYRTSRVDARHAAINMVYPSGSASSPFGSSLMVAPQTSAVMPHALSADGNYDVDTSYYLGVYALLGVVYVFICLGRELLLFWGSLHASWQLHERLLNGIMRAKFKFFDSTPLGQLMNRFSKDVQSIDQEVAPVAIGMIHCAASIVTVVILISAITPGFLIPGVFISLIYIATGLFYIRSSRDLKRIEAVQRSPLFQHFGETLSGVVTIRAYGDESRFITESHKRVNAHNRPFIYLWAANRWLAFRIDIAGALVSFSSALFVVLSVDSIDAGAAGLALTYAITFTQNVLWVVRLYVANEQNMNAVERVQEYIDVEQEAKAHIPETRPASDWPKHGAVEFSAYSTRYRPDLDLVLKDLTFSIQAGEKVGIVGRTGAGKSSLALALFRGLEAAEGKIVIDNVDIGLIGLQDLREAITIVPQDPTLFTGTIRNNLDPFGLFTDEEIFTALRRVQLISSSNLESEMPSGTSTPNVSSAAPTLTPASTPHLPITGLADSAPSTGTVSSDATLVRFASNTKEENKNVFRNLSSPVAESGSNLSQGQRQLLCLARALLKSPKVLVMDEATASIDYATDSKIQDTLRELKGNTIITIAHRLQTIIDYNKVLVLDKGQLVEYASPYELLQQENGVFRSMCETNGDFASLQQTAKAAAKAKNLIDLGDEDS